MRAGCVLLIRRDETALVVLIVQFLACENLLVMYTYLSIQNIKSTCTCVCMDIHVLCASYGPD